MWITFGLPAPDRLYAIGTPRQPPYMVFRQLSTVFFYPQAGVDEFG